MVSPDTPTESQLGFAYLLWPFLIFGFFFLVILGLYFWKREKIEKHWFQHKTVRVVYFTIATCMIPLAAGAWADITDASRILGGVMYASDLTRINFLAALVGTYISSQVVWWMHGDAWQNKLKKLYLAAKQQEKLKEAAREERDFVLELASSYNGVVGLKGDRVRESINKKNDRLTVSAVLDPSLQIVKLIHATFGIFKASLKHSSQKSKLRLAFFEVNDRYLERVHAWDGNTQNCLQTEKDSLRHNLSLDAPFGSLAVYSLVHGTIEVAELAKEDDKDDKCPFNYFQSGQNERILSMLAMPLFRENQRSASHVVTIDTNYPGFFKNSRKWQYELVRDNFQQRLFLEMGVKKLLEDTTD